MPENHDVTLMAGFDGGSILSNPSRTRARWSLAGLTLGLVVGAWLGGGPDRYGEAEGVIGGARGACRTMAKSGHYAAATLRDLAFQQRTSVRDLGLAQQVETRLWQDKRLAAEGIIVEIEQEGTAVLKGLVPDADHKEIAVTLTRETRGVARVVDQLAVSPTSRTIETTPAAPVPTGVATGVRTVR